MGDAAHMRGRAAFLICLLVAGCHKPQPPEKPTVTDPAKLARLRQIFVPDAYARPEDQKRAERIREGYDGPMPCQLDKPVIGAIAPLPIDKCRKMTPPQRMTGLWSNVFEVSEFCPAPARKCPNDTKQELKADPYPLFYGNFEVPHIAGYEDTPPGGLYAVDFIGRRTVYPASGGTAERDKLVVADRMISIKEIKPPPPQPTAAQMKAYAKVCKANHTCIPSGNEPDEADYARIERGHVEDYFKECAGKSICMPNSWAEKWRKKHPDRMK